MKVVLLMAKTAWNTVAFRPAGRKPASAAAVLGAAALLALATPETARAAFIADGSKIDLSASVLVVQVTNETATYQRTLRRVSGTGPLTRTQTQTFSPIRNAYGVVTNTPVAPALPAGYLPATGPTGQWAPTGIIPPATRTEIRWVNTFGGLGSPLQGRTNVAAGTLSGTFAPFFTACTSLGAVDCVRQQTPITIGRALPNPFPTFAPGTTPVNQNLPSPSVSSGLWWSFTQGGRTLSFVVDDGSAPGTSAPSVTLQPRRTTNAVGGGISITGSGVFRLTGFQDTPGFFDFTMQQIGTATNVSASYVAAAPIPAPAALGLFGLALAGLAAARGQRRA